MLETLETIVAIVFVFGVVIFVHELGHFLAAKAMGVYAPRFSIGFGKTLWSRKWGETEYVIAAFPLGGYVRLASRLDDAMQMLEGGGETPAPDAAELAEDPAARPKYYDPNGIAPFGPNPVPESRWFESKPLPGRLLIMCAGVAMNVVLAFVIYVGLNLSVGRLVLPRDIGAVEPLASAPEIGRDIAPGDTVLAVDGAPVQTWNEAVARMVTDSSDVLTIRTQRGETRIPVGGAGQPTREAVASALYAAVPPVIRRVVSGTPAAKSGLRGGDRITTIDGDSVRTWGEVVTRIQRSPGRELHFGVQRAGAPVTIRARPDSLTFQDGGRDTVIGQIGAEGLVRHERMPLGAAVRDGWAETREAAGLVVGALRLLVREPREVKNLTGVVGIGGSVATAAKQGIEYVLRLLAFISVNLAIFNLLPIPILDGGQILITVAESVKGGALSLRTREALMRAGLAAIALLFVIVTFNDLTRLVRRLTGL